MEHQGDTLTIVHITNPTKYLLLPIEEGADEALVRLDTGDAADVDMDIRLARSQSEYFVPFSLPAGQKEATVRVMRVPQSAVCWKELRLTDIFDTTNIEKFRPTYHHTPLYGWMNDANGLVYKDGEYHLYFQYNPYGSVWGNMHWGHSVSRDLVHWEHLAPALERDTLGHIFSGSCIVDQFNSAGTGKDNIIAFYTSHKNFPGSQREVQCMTYSTDNGRTFHKYEDNPVLTPFDGLQDFRDPKVFWYEPEQKWVMIVSADKNMRFYASHDLKQEKRVDNLFTDNDGAFELDLELVANGDKSYGVELLNNKGEKVTIYLNAENRVVMDRSESGNVGFGNLVQPHQRETDSSRRACINGLMHYKNDFALGTWAPMEKNATHKLQIFVDKSSIELFVDGGHAAMTNLVFPDVPYNSLRFFAADGKAVVKSATLYKLGL